MGLGSAAREGADVAAAPGCSRRVRSIVFICSREGEEARRENEEGEREEEDMSLSRDADIAVRTSSLSFVSYIESLGFRV